MRIQPSHTNITIATVNIHFGGIAVRNDILSVLDWVITAFIIVKLNSRKYMKWRIAKNRANPVKHLIDHTKPDILIVNEIMPDLDQHISDYMKENYASVILSRGADIFASSEPATAIATTYNGETLDVSMPRTSSGGSCGIYIPKLNTSVIAFHPAALDKKARWSQIRYIAEIAEKEAKKGRNVLIGGDCNSEYEEMKKADTRFETLPIVNCSVPSFPTARIMRQLRYPWWLPLSWYAGARNGKRAIDNLFIPKTWKLLSVSSLENSSDHEAVIVTART